MISTDSLTSGRRGVVRLESGGKSGSYVDLEKVLHGINHPRPYNPKYPYAIDHIIYNRPWMAWYLRQKPI